MNKDHAFRHTLILPNDTMVLELPYATLMWCLHLPSSYSHIPRHMKAFMAHKQRIPPFLSAVYDTEGQSG